ncbi:MAG: MotA/TolQ/ExbB proton channel family protein [Myxococcales bacterium]|nr:MotA/TolQ/ExbB proton channel family protein [Myxococcales bacterium]
MEINLMELWHEMGLPVRTVVIVLTLQAIGCITVTIDRLIVLYQSRKRAQMFAEIAGPGMQSANYPEVLQNISDVPSSHLTSFLDVGIRNFLTRRQAGDEAERAAELTRRALERKGDAISRDLNRGMNVLASTGSTAPFVGLLGTVLGIINAFKLIAADGSGGIGTIGSAIGEALVVTGYGLMVAIPAVLLFNMLSSMIAKYEAGLLNAGSELIDQLETMEAAGAQPAVTNSMVAPAPQAPVHQPVEAQQPVEAAAGGAEPGSYAQPLPRPAPVPATAVPATAAVPAGTAPAAPPVPVRRRWSTR